MFIDIPVSKDDPLYVQRVTLEGVDYLFRFDYNERENRWYLDIGDIDGNWLATGIKLVANVPLLNKRKERGLPPGELMVISLGGESPGFGDLGALATLSYATSDEIAGRSLSYSLEASDMIFPSTDPGDLPELGGDLSGPIADARVVGIQGVPIDNAVPADGDVLTFDVGDGKAKWQPPAIPAAAQVPFDPTGTGLAAEDVQAAIVEASGILAAVEIPLPASGSPDTTVYTAPTSKLVEIFAIKALLVEPMTGAGTVTLTMGATAGGDGYVIAQPITSASTGLVAGHTKSLATLGARFPANAGYVAALAPGDEIVARLTASGEVTGGKLLVIVEGRVTT